MFTLITSLRFVLFSLSHSQLSIISSTEILIFDYFDGWIGIVHHAAGVKHGKIPAPANENCATGECPIVEEIGKTLYEE